MAAYMVAVCDITNPGPGLKTYSEKSAKLSASYGGKYLVRSPVGETIEGELLKGKHIIISEFPSMEKLNEFYNDPEYQEKQGRHRHLRNYFLRRRLATVC